MLKVDSIWKSYDDNSVLKNISFSIGKSEIVGLLGPNGAGKSTLLKIIAAYHMADSGAVHINGYSIEEESIKAKSCCGYLGENAPLFEYMTVKEYLQFLLTVKCADKKGISVELRRLVNLFKLNEYENSPISSLSSGYKQRCALAGAFAGDIKLLILDEPGKGLDPIQIIELRDILKSFSHEITVIISSHILSEMEILCDRILIIDEGILKYDTAVQNNLESLPVIFKAEISGELENIQSLNNNNKIKVLSIKNKDGNLYKIDMEISADEYKKNKAVVIFDSLQENSLRLHNIDMEKKNLEDIFIDITGKTFE